MKLVIQFDSENLDQKQFASILNICMDDSMYLRVLEIEPETSMETEVKDYLNDLALAKYSD